MTGNLVRFLCRCLVFRKAAIIGQAAYRRESVNAHVARLGNIATGRLRRNTHDTSSRGHLEGSDWLIRRRRGNIVTRMRASVITLFLKSSSVRGGHAYTHIFGLDFCRLTDGDRPRPTVNEFVNASLPPIICAVIRALAATSDNVISVSQFLIPLARSCHFIFASDRLARCLQT